MSRLLYFVFFGFALAAITNTFAKYQEIPLFAAAQAQESPDQKLEAKVNELEDKFDYLKQKSIILDQSVDTNEKLRYLTHSDNFEEALFLIDYLTDRFNELDLSNIAYKDVAVADIGFYMDRLEENLEVVESDLRRLSVGRYRVSKK